MRPCPNCGIVSEVEVSSEEDATHIIISTECLACKVVVFQMRLPLSIKAETYWE